MARREKKTDVVIVGLGWTGSILAMELTKEGIEVLALERGPDQNTVPDFAYPNMIDELKYGVRFGLMSRPRDSTVSVRHSPDDSALPYRVLGSFLPGNGVGGAGTHWNGHTWRALPEELRLRSYVTERFGADIIPPDMTIQDWGISYEDLIPASDAAAEVIEVGEDVEIYKPGDRVISTFHPRWFGGPLPASWPYESYGSWHDG